MILVGKAACIFLSVFYMTHEMLPYYILHDLYNTYIYIYVIRVMAEREEVIGVLFVKRFYLIYLHSDTRL